MSDTAVNVTAMWLVWVNIVILWVPIRFFVGLATGNRPFAGIKHAIYIAIIFAVATVFMIN